MDQRRGGTFSCVNNESFPRCSIIIIAQYLEKKLTAFVKIEFKPQIFFFIYVYVKLLFYW